jgi:Scavenger mRNA decapping enzyme (DcpS) N-terminal
MANFAIQSLAAIKQFEFERLLDEGKLSTYLLNMHIYTFLITDPITRYLALLGTFPSGDDEQTRLPAILRIEKTALDPTLAKSFCSTAVERVQLVENNDVACVT